ncbi:MAG: hypothetical protein Q4A31_07820 [Corynebacterium sp.]|uniref:hypothetical protein n=1 Tax=Corynebacterium sp. TaxID=1720 RepID=UPI0026DBC06D|nr:hypothetical protein [Corynebacterium sp.]MDO4761808.1 hypothetical protein [Corynebacterium sp.]
MKKHLCAVFLCSVLLVGCAQAPSPQSAHAPVPTTLASQVQPPSSADSTKNHAASDVGIFGLTAPDGAIEVSHKEGHEYDPQVRGMIPDIEKYDPHFFRWMGQYPDIPYEQLLEMVRAELDGRNQSAEISGMKFAEITSIQNPFSLESLEDGTVFKEHQLCWEEKIDDHAYRLLSIFVREMEFPDRRISGLEYYYQSPAHVDCNVQAQLDFSQIAGGF